MERLKMELNIMMIMKEFKLLFEFIFLVYNFLKLFLKNKS